jgi:hypothetical protein
MHEEHWDVSDSDVERRHDSRENASPIRADLLPVAVGVMAHNEEATIEACLRSILTEPCGRAGVTSVVVVASGCTDATASIVRRLAACDDRLRLIEEPVRGGKAAAINLFLAATSEPVCALVSGDVVLDSGSLSRLLEPFVDPTVAMTGGRPVPTNSTRGITGRVVDVLWTLHHDVALRAPKLGEVVAFRRTFDSIDERTLTDEVSIEAIVTANGGRLVYIPDAIVHNRGPETVREFIAQRRRIHAGHLRVRATCGHRPATMDMGAVLRAAGRRLLRSPEQTPALAAAAVLECVARGQARLDVRLGREPQDGRWEPIVSTKRLARPGQVIRRHCEDVLELHVRATDRRHARQVLPDVGRLVRRTDVVLDGGTCLIVEARCDIDGAASLAARLSAALPGCRIIAEAGASLVGRAVEPRVAVEEAAS